MANTHKGGHVNTYYDAPAKAYRDYGVQVYFPYEDALDFIARFNLSLVPGLAPRGSTSSRYIDFSTGKELLSYASPNATLQRQAITNFYNALVDNGYDKMVQPGFWGLPRGRRSLRICFFLSASSPPNTTPPPH